MLLSQHQMTIKTKDSKCHVMSQDDDENRYPPHPDPLCTKERGKKEK